MSEQLLSYNELIVELQQNAIILASIAEEQRILEEQRQNDLKWFAEWLTNQNGGE